MCNLPLLTLLILLFVLAQKESYKQKCGSRNICRTLFLFATSNNLFDIANRAIEFLGRYASLPVTSACHIVGTLFADPEFGEIGEVLRNFPGVYDVGLRSF